MSKPNRTILQALLPCLVLGVAIALGIGILMVLSYVLFWGLAIGGILWIMFLLKQYLLPSKSQKKQKGRIIEHQDH